MHLKHLVLNGYKTFANKTAFDFTEGITAVIGPNGSGKSNVADALRWALGEQQFSLLRGKRTDDMIFAGSTRRPRSSMAEVLLTFDNSDGFFPVEFTEIAIGRRAYRDGSNEYLLNGNRVRLRDIVDLLGHSGLAERTYTVIGQGLVDTALTQRPEERRALFEEAAGITAYRDRRDDALRKLEETHHNLERVRDILTEITPRVNQLERQATRARQYQVLSSELREHTRTWFSYSFRSVRDAVTSASRLRDQLQSELVIAQGAVAELEGVASRLQDEQTALRARAADAQPRRDEARRSNEALLRDLAVLSERSASVSAQLTTARRELQDRASALEGLTLRAAHAAAALVGAQDTLEQRRRELETADAAATERKAARGEMEGQRAQAQQALAHATTESTAAQNHLNSLRARQSVLMRRSGELTDRATRANEQRERELANVGALEAQIEADTLKAADIREQQETLEREWEAARSLLAAAQAAQAAAEAEEKMATRVNLFAELRSQQGGGELAELAHGAHILGLRGTLAALMQVLPDDQRAVEAALGNLLRAAVVETTDGLARTRAWLVTQKARNARLTVIPLPELRPASAERARLDAALIEQARAVHARPLIESISAPAWLKPALQILLSRYFIAHDLHSARALAARLPEGCLCVTRAGEVAYSDGVLGLPPGPRSPIILGEEEAQTNAPLIDPAAARANRENAVHQRDRAQREVEAARRRMDEYSRSRELIARDANSRRARRDDIARRITSLEEQLAQLAGDIEQNEQELTSLSQQVVTADADGARTEENRAQAAQHLAALESQLREHMAGGWLESLNAANAAVAMASEAVRSAQNLRRERLAALEDIQTQRDARARLVEQLDAQYVTAHKALTHAQAEADAAALQLREAEDNLQPILAELIAVEQELSAVETRRRDAERTLRETESRLNATLLELARHDDELRLLHERAIDLLDVDDRRTNGDALPALEVTESPVHSLQSETETPEQTTSPTPPPDSRAQVIALLESLPEVTELPPGMEERMTQLRNQIKRLGLINFEAQAEYEELKQRHTFLSEQTSDLEKASASLQQVIVELNDVMHATFKQTFEAIATAFQSTFKILFGGGQARITLMNADSLDDAGIEIHAQPPGKRPQALALLSGGERSLTAAALLFAILRVKPTPFCVLDEVDAALDEANVGRFRNMLETLAEQTQFIIITHNRRTVEVANMVYGISMGVDGASTALSLRLDEVEMKE